MSGENRLGEPSFIALWGYLPQCWLYGSLPLLQPLQKYVPGQGAQMQLLRKVLLAGALALAGRAGRFAVVASNKLRAAHLGNRGIRD